MPYKLVWVPASGDKSLPVYPECPEGEAHHCHYCRGWIPGVPETREINTMSIEHPLSGRRGTAFYCLRCGEEIDFIGEIS